jgi:hypothetical protein
MRRGSVATCFLYPVAPKWWVSAAICVCLPAAALAGEKPLPPGTAGGALSVNRIHHGLAHAYTWFGAVDPTKPGDASPSRRLVGLCNRPLDAATLDLVQDPSADFDLLRRMGAVVAIAVLDDHGTVRGFRCATPGLRGFHMPDSTLVAGEVAEGGGVMRGEIVIRPNTQAHAFDPDHVPLLQGEIRFAVKDTRRPLRGKALPEDGGDPGAAYRAFNEALRAGDRDAIRRRLRGIWTEAGAAAGELLLWKEVEVEELIVHGGRSDRRRALLLCSGNCEAYGGQTDFRVFLVNEGGEWRIDALKPGLE